MKDKWAGVPIPEVVCTRLKIFSVLKANENIIKTTKGVKSNDVVKKQVSHEKYKETLFERKQMCHGMNILRSEGQEIYGKHMNKVSLSAFDSKRWIVDDGIHTNVYGSTPELTEDELADIEELLAGY